MSGYNIDDNIWEVIENYFRTINKNLVSHQLDSFNMFIMNQINNELYGQPYSESDSDSDDDDESSDEDKSTDEDKNKND